ncbi:cysteine-rich CWC family protein [Massilia niastensis]|uniref:cysteine-rich CWC family protein n=1 Tax=Massilia niastensis TaxID=544911 RepID=UPI000A00C706|nr:cysteine-rich CWC family protein [Massilia niastensis]
MSTCTRCGAAFGCAMADGASGPCWCTLLPPAVPVPQEAAGCWCPSCLRAHIAEQQGPGPAPDGISAGS